MESSGTYPPQRMRVLTKLKTILQRAPKNARSNRWWIVWGGKVYFRSNNLDIQVSETWPVHVRNWVASVTRYALLTERLRNSPLAPEKSAIFLTELGMFGNMSRRLANGLSLGSSIDSGSVIVPKEVIFHEGIFRQGTHEISGIRTLWLGSAPSRKTNDVAAMFVGDMFSSQGWDTSSDNNHVDEAWRTLNDILMGDAERTPLGPETLAIHLRGGDVFGPRKPRAYGQPPLSYYELVLRSAPWKEVVLVHQDESNPVLPGIRDLCRELNIEVRNQSGTALEDIRTLLRAESIVAGRGTFVPAVANLSRYCTTVFFFEDKCNLIPKRSGIRLVRVADLEKNYKVAILSNNWQNTPGQREMMTSYPLSSLVMEGP